jgi:uncharacterized protein (DUF2141 family)
MNRSGSLALLAALAAFAPRVQAEEPAQVLEFRTIMRGADGVVRCGLFTEKGWLKTPLKAAVAAIRDGAALCVFKGVPKGVYGISAFHDENSNGKLDTNFIGLPTEDYCASRDARGSFGPPSFSDAQFSYTGGAKRLSAQMK